jgi:hypothetical protein
MSTGQGMALGTPAWLTWASAAVLIGRECCSLPDCLARKLSSRHAFSWVPHPWFSRFDLPSPPSDLSVPSLKNRTRPPHPSRRGCRARIRSVMCRASRAYADAPRAATISTISTDPLVRQPLTSCLLFIGRSPIDTRVVWCTHVGLERPTGSTYKVLAKAWQGSDEAGAARSC